MAPTNGIKAVAEPSRFPRHILLAFLALLPTLPTTIEASGPTKIWINQVPEYSQLPSCALSPLSTVVRGMASGCGDPNSQFTTFSCFCTGSSSKMVSIISRDVASTCRSWNSITAANATVTEVSSALDVFRSYCALTSAEGSNPTASSSVQPSTASQAATVAVTSAPQTSTPAASRTSSKGLTTGAKIAIGVAVPVGAIVVALLSGLLFWTLRKQRSRQEDAAVELPEAAGPAPGELGSTTKYAHELEEGVQPPQELGTEHPVELPGSEIEKEKIEPTPDVRVTT